MSAPVFTDAEFMTSKDKARVYKAWVAFLKSGLAWGKFTEVLYKHLYMHCMFIAHYNRAGFYDVYFGSDAVATLKFLRMFDPDGTGECVEGFCCDLWLTNKHYADLHQAMREALRPLLPKLREQVKAAERERDLAHARALLAKHGETS